MATLTSRRMAAIALAAARDKKACRPIILNVARLTTMMEFMLVCHGRSQPQVRAIAEHIRLKLKEEGKRLLHWESDRGERWILLDFGEIICHIFAEETREFYALEKLWGGTRSVAKKRKTKSKRS